MQLTPLTPKQFIRKSFLRQSCARDDLLAFKKELATLLDKAGHDESEEHYKNIAAEFLRGIGFRGAYEINTKEPWLKRQQA